MRKEVIMPKIGLDMTEGTILEWKKAVGDRVAKDDILCEIETDKATTEVTSALDGVLVEYGKTDDSKLGSTAVYAVFRSRLRKADQLP